MCLGITAKGLPNLALASFVSLLHHHSPLHLSLHCTHPEVLELPSPAGHHAPLCLVPAHLSPWTTMSAQSHGLFGKRL